MKSELESMYSNNAWSLVKAPNGIKPFVVNGFTREREGWMRRLKSSKQDW
jgi:hypothetical protein